MIVEAIFEGKIVRVSEEYANREGLLIVKRPQAEPAQAKAPPWQYEKNYGRKVVSVEKLRKPIGYYKNNVVKELIENFQWEILHARKVKNITRKQLANAVGINEEMMKMIENGILPEDNFIIINKVQDYLHINLRRDGKSFSPSVVPKTTPKFEPKPLPKTEPKFLPEEAQELSGEDTDLFDLNDLDSEEKEESN
jgi:ribosome-binding protein aMBF1 (putative translation factor)